VTPTGKESFQLLDKWLSRARRSSKGGRSAVLDSAAEMVNTLLPNGGVRPFNPLKPTVAIWVQL